MIKYIFLFLFLSTYYLHAESKGMLEIGVVSATNWNYLIKNYKLGICRCKLRIGVKMSNPYPVAVIGAAMDRNYPHIKGVAPMLNKIMYPLQDFQLKLVSPLGEKGYSAPGASLMGGQFYEVQKMAYPDPFEMLLIQEHCKKLQNMGSNFTGVLASRLSELMGKGKLSQSDQDKISKGVDNNNTTNSKNTKNDTSKNNTTKKDGSSESDEESLASKIPTEKMMEFMPPAVQKSAEMMELINLGSTMPLADITAQYQGMLAEVQSWMNYWKWIVEILKRSVARPNKATPFCLPLWNSIGDTYNWRTGNGEILNYKSFLSDTLISCEFAYVPGVDQKFAQYCIGGWESIYPRTGFNNQLDFARGAGVSTYRALSWAEDGPTRIDFHDVWKVTNWGARQNDVYQMISPKKISEPFRFGTLVSSIDDVYEDDTWYTFIQWVNLTKCTPCYEVRRQ